LDLDCDEATGLARAIGAKLIKPDLRNCRLEEGATVIEV